MRRGGDGEEIVTISPPPEFQDPVTLPPPPIFRDSVPFETLADSNNLNFSNSSDATTGAEASTGKPTEKVCVTDFATKVSSDILNKAMVIAKDSPENSTTENSLNSDESVTCHTHDTTNPCSCGTAPRYENGSSEATDSNTISTTTSWEYVSKSSSLSDLRKFGAAFLSTSSPSGNHNSIKQNVENSSSSSSHIPLGRSLLPLGIVPLPPAHNRHSHHNNGFHHLPHHGYRLTQQDLLQPTTDPLVPVSHNGSDTRNTKNDSNPVMRSTSFNLDNGAARKHTYKYRLPSQSYSISKPVNQLNANQHSQTNQSSSGKPQNHQRPRQQAFVLVAENPESGASDVYNVPFQSDIYSLPIDTIFKENKADSSSSSKPILSKRSSTSSTPLQNSQSNLNQNQRLKSESLVASAVPATSNAVTPPLSRKTNLSRRTSCGSDSANEHGTKKCISNNLSSQSRDLNSSSSQLQQERRLSQSDVDEHKPCKPPQRTTSLSAQPLSQQKQSQHHHPKNEIPISTTGNTSSSISCVAPPPSLSSSSSKQFTISNQEAFTEFKPIPPERTTTAMINCTRTSDETGSNIKTIGIGNCSSNHFQDHNSIRSSFNIISSVKKPRSRSVDPGNELERSCPARTSIKRTVDVTYTNNQSCFDNPDGSGSVLNINNTSEIDTEQSGTSSLLANSAKEHSTVDRKNPLGISLLNLFRRSKPNSHPNEVGSASSGALITTKQQNQIPFKSDLQTHCQDEGDVAGQGKLSSSSSYVNSDNHTSSTSHISHRNHQNGNNNEGTLNINNNKEDTSYYFRELPPPPPGQHSDSSSDEQGFSPVTSPLECRDFAASIEKVKDCGWYWGPLSSEAAEDLLKNEPDGSFIVRDSSDARYIFSLTFKLNGLVRHVRIEHDQGNFSFGPLTRFKAATIVDFVEKAVAHSRSGRYLFFLHRRPVLGPMQVQLLHPYSRFMHPRSLKHMCRFVILKYVRRDLIHTLPLPKPMQDYLNTPHYYFEPPERRGSTSVGGASGASGTGSSIANTNINSHQSRGSLAVE